MSDKKIGVGDFPPFIRFELEPKHLEKLFSKASSKVGTIEVDILSEEFWTSFENETKKPRQEIIFGKGKGRVIKSLQSGPLRAKDSVTNAF